MSRQNLARWAFADRTATAPFAAFASKPIGLESRPSRFWRRPVGPGWSSFAVLGDRIYTQEQRGEDEVVAAYNLNTGEPVWRHRDAARFWESNGGAGPRAHANAQQRSRLLARCDRHPERARRQHDGSVVWSRNAASDTDRRRSRTGAFSSSPLVVGDLVIVCRRRHTRRLRRRHRHAALGRSGRRRRGYSSPQLATIDGVAQIVLLNGAGRDRRRARQTANCSGSTRGPAMASCSRPSTGGRRRPDRQRFRPRDAYRHAPHRRRSRGWRMVRRRALDVYTD